MGYMRRLLNFATDFQHLRLCTWKLFIRGNNLPWRLTGLGHVLVLAIFLTAGLSIS